MQIGNQEENQFDGSNEWFFIAPQTFLKPILSFNHQLLNTSRSSLYCLGQETKEVTLLSSQWSHNLTWTPPPPPDNKHLKLSENGNNLCKFLKQKRV